MVLFIILGMVVVMAFVVLGVLFSMLGKEGQKAQEEAVSLKDLSSLKIDTLTKENESLKAQKVDLEQAQQKLVGLQLEASGLKTENANLQSQLESVNAKAHLLEEEMAAVKRPEPDAALRQELESLKSEQIQLKQKYGDLEAAYQKLREFNSHLIEKNDLLQYEMIKSRALSSGLERVSFNYKNQLEDFLKKVNAAQAANDYLSHVKNRLEEIVSEVKLENEELVKKDQLAEFELEKNRLRLANLEREYEDLKARMPQKDSQA